MSGSGITAPKLLLHDMIRSLLVRAVTQEQQYSFFRYSEFSSQKLGITAKDTRLCSSSGQAWDSQCFLFALWWRRLPVGRRNNRQKGLRGANAEGDACKRCIHGNVSSPQLKTERGPHRRNGERCFGASHVTVYLRQADSLQDSAWCSKTHAALVFIYGNNTLSDKAALRGF